MFRNQYDTDVTTFSPAGRLHQVEYAMEAVKQGACSVGLRNTSSYVVLASIKRSNNDLAASSLQKIFTIDQHMGIATAGLVSDARVLAQYMRGECQNYQYQYDNKMPSSRLVVALSDKAQHFTQRSDKRPYGVGLLVAAVDRNNSKPHLFETQPSGVYFEYYAQAIGARAQSAKTYFEKFYESFGNASKDELIIHALHALAAASPVKLTSRNVSLAFVGVNEDFTIITDEAVLREYVHTVTQKDDNDGE